MNALKTTSEGNINLHIWRTGQAYLRQKGGRFLAEWNCLYFSPRPRPEGETDIRYHDIRRDIPYPDNSFDAVYALRTLEHLTFREAGAFAFELFRVLKPGGLVRVTTPDLEDIVREYLKQLDACAADRNPRNILRYHWITLELLDQMVRLKSGGAMVDALKEHFYDADYAKERYRDVFEEFLPKESKSSPAQPAGRPGTTSFLRKVARKVKDLFVQKPAPEIPDPRLTLEANRWMHDRLSLRRLLEGAGFRDVTAKSYKESGIPGWERFDFDRSNYGDHPFEPSLYMEGKKAP